MGVAFFFFKQKTAYEILRSDWSSDVCSSDLLLRALWQVAADVHRPGEEAGIEKVQDRVLDAADILVHVHPVGGFGHIGGRRRAGGGEASEIPRRIDEGVHRVGLAPRGVSAGGAGGVAPA